MCGSFLWFYFLTGRDALSAKSAELPSLPCMRVSQPAFTNSTAQSTWPLMQVAEAPALALATARTAKLKAGKMRDDKGLEGKGLEVKGLDDKGVGNDDLCISARRITLT